MRDPARIDDICDRLKAVWHQYPDMRLGQLIYHVLTTYNNHDLFYSNNDLFYIEDSDLVLHIENTVYRWMVSR